MNIIGKWKVAYVLGMGEESFVWHTPDEYRACADVPEEAEKTLSTILEFAEGGKVFCCFPIPPETPQEAIDEAIKAGAIRVKDGCAYDESKWKEEDGKYFYYTEIEGEVFGEKTSPWIELTIEEDGTLNFMGMQRYEKI